MATEEQFDAIMDRIDAATNNVAAELRALKDQIKNQGLPKDVEDAVLTRLEASATALEAVGKEDTGGSTAESTSNAGTIKQDV